MKTILITGAANGIGKATSILFAQKGWHVVATMRNEKQLSTFSEYQNITTYLLDVKDNESVKTSIKTIIQDATKIDVIVNNAGIYDTNPLEATPEQTIHNIIETNIKGVLWTTQAILEHFRANKAGVIINISSLAGRVTLPFQSVYHTSKWAVEGLSESLYYELKPLNIKVKVIEPGVIKSNLYHSVSDFNFEDYPIEYQTDFKKWHSYVMQNVENGYSPELEAKTIFKAANSKSWKLRYTTDFMTKTLFALRAIFPLSVFQKIVKMVSL